jgi:DNA polymerase-3 subunit delta'
VFDEIIGQDTVVETLKSSLERGNLSHAYLFLGKAGLGKTAAAYALAASLICEKGGCGTCSVCSRIKRGIHPDVQIIEPIGATGYLIDQIRDIIHQVSRAPVESDHKVYILYGVDQFNDSSANAFLKTLEEPPHNVTFILFAHSLGAIISTIRSRCQIIRFKPLPPQTMIDLLCARTGCSVSDARCALAACGDVLRDAQEYINSIARQNTRDEVVLTFQNLLQMDDAEVIDAAKRIMDQACGPVAELRATHEADTLNKSDFLSRTGLKELEKTQKRQLTAYQHRCIREVFTVFASVLRDVVCMMVDASALASNGDVLEDSTRFGADLKPADIARCLEAVECASARVDAHVDPRLTLEVMLFEIRKVRTCPQ